jgi:hypothetical protein
MHRLNSPKNLSRQWVGLRRLGVGPYAHIGTYERGIAPCLTNHRRHRDKRRLPKITPILYYRFRIHVK